MQDIKGYVHDFSRDQHGSRFIQQKLADAPPEEIMAVCEEVQPHAISLMQDVFGNYVIQKCFEHGSKVSLPLSRAASTSARLDEDGSKVDLPLFPHAHVLLVILPGSMWQLLHVRQLRHPEECAQRSVFFSHICC